MSCPALPAVETRRRQERTRERGRYVTAWILGSSPRMTKWWVRMTAVEGGARMTTVEGAATSNPSPSAANAFAARRRALLSSPAPSTSCSRLSKEPHGKDANRGL